VGRRKLQSSLGTDSGFAIYCSYSHYGLFVVKKARPQLVRYFLFGNLKYFIQRLSGIGLLFFIPAHIYKTRIDPALSGYVLDFRHMSEAFHEPLTLAVYFLGVLGVAYHLANGIWQFSIGWGIVTTEKGMHRVQIFSYIVFVLLLLMGYGAIGGFYMGS
jgi:succinate dehydrogenase / fumarate reductase cytochrome b subunit